MHTNHHDDAEALAVAEKLGYEPRDIDCKMIYKASLWLWVLCIVSIPISYGVVVLIQNQAGVDHRFGGETELRPALPGGPILQTNVSNHEDIMDLRAKENDAIQNFRSSSKGKVSIPIEVAKERVIQQGAIR